jgi:hypothetical protein
MTGLDCVRKYHFRLSVVPTCASGRRAFSVDALAHYIISFAGVNEASQMRSYGSAYLHIGRF